MASGTPKINQRSVTAKVVVLYGRSSVAAPLCYESPAPEGAATEDRPYRTSWLLLD